MRAAKQPARRGAFAAALMLSGAVIGMIPQQAAAQTETVQRNFNIPAQPLTEALLVFGRQSGIQVTADANITSGKNSSGVAGMKAPAQALSELLAGTGLTYRFLSNGAVRIEPAPRAADGTIQLGPVRVAGTSGRGVGASMSRVIADENSREAENNYTLKTTAAATHLNLSPKETPQSVVAITQKQMEEQNLTQGIQVLEQAPGVVVEQRGVPGVGKMSYYSRGFEINNFRINGVSLGVGSNLIQQRFSNHGQDTVASLDTGIYESVTIVRGSTGLVSGTGDPSASIDFQLKRPTEELRASMDLSYGTWDRFRAMADVSGALTADKSIRGRLVAVHANGDHWMDRVQTNNKTIYATIDADITPDTIFSLSGVYARDKIDGAAPVGPTLARVDDWGDGLQHNPFPLSFNPASNWTTASGRTINLIANLRHDFDDNWNFSANYAYTDMKRSSRYFAIGAENYSGYGDRGYYDVAKDRASFGFGRTTNHGHTHTIDIALRGKFDLLGQTHDLVVGANAYRGEMRMPHWGSTEPFYQTGQMAISDWMDGNVPTNILKYVNDELEWNNGHTGISEKQYGLYFSTRLKPVERLSIILGGRFNALETQVERWKLDWNVPSMDSFYKDTDATYKDGGTFIPYAGILYDITPEVTVFASYAAINKPHSDPYTMFDINGNILPAVSGNTIEAGVKAGLFDNRLNIHLSGYRMMQNNQSCYMDVYRLDENGWRESVYVSNHPILDGFSVTPSTTCNGYEVWGGDFSVTGAITPRWMISASYSLQIDKKDMRKSGGLWQMLDDGTLVEDPNSWRGERLETDPYPNGYDNPKHLVKIVTSYRFTDRFTAGGSFIWRSRTGYDRNDYGVGSPNWEAQEAVNEILSQKSFAVVGLMANYDVNDRVRLGVNVNNLFDKSYRTNGFGSFYGAPRNVVASLRVKY